MASEKELDLQTRTPTLPRRLYGVFAKMHLPMDCGPISKGRTVRILPLKQ